MTIARTNDIAFPDRARTRVYAILIVTVILVTAAAYIGAQRLFETQAASVAKSQHALYLRSLNETLKQHQYLPFVLSQNPNIAASIIEGREGVTNATLAQFADASGLEAIYIMDLDGQVRATSNYANSNSFLGQNYGFRPYFREAAEGKHADYFAIGATTGRPGYFVAEPLRNAAGVQVGVIAIKLDISELQSSWERRGENVLVTNADGIIVLASNPAWLYHAITPITQERRTAIEQSRQFADEPLTPLAWSVQGAGKVLFEGQAFLDTSGRTEQVNWTVHFLTPQATIHRQTLLATALLAAVVAILIGFATFLRSLRIANALEASQRHRRELITANQKLLEMQVELERTSKMAALGHLAASVTHELGQPISALKNHLMAAELGNEITSPRTMTNLQNLAARMEAITRQLRFFARRDQDEMHPVDMAQVIAEAQALLQHDFDRAHISVDRSPPNTRCLVNGNQLQLEQAMVNLLRNALHATMQMTHPTEHTDQNQTIHVACSCEGRTVSVTIRDAGNGLGGLTLTQLQEPFFSTKASGVGMGLGLAITSEIIRAHGGEMTAHDHPEGGAVFIITLPVASGGTDETR